MKPGDRLPSEITLSKQLDVRRSHVREAMNKLEFHGILETLPQSGTYIQKNIGPRALGAILFNIVNNEKEDIISLIDTRRILEIRAAELTASNASESELQDLATIHEQFMESIRNGDRGLDEDLYFHLKIAAYSHSEFLTHFLTLITPEIIRLCAKTGRIEDGRYSIVIAEHTAILDALVLRDSKKAAEEMRKHLDRSMKNRLVESTTAIVRQN